MSVAALESARAKLERASNHLELLRSERPASVNFIHEESKKELVMYAKLPRESFVRYSLTAGEVIHQARSALEHAVWEMVPELKRSRNTGFPVFTSSADFDAQRVRKIDGIHANAAGLIRSLQPFRGKNLLWELHELWNIDKHRTLNTCVTIIQGSAVYYRFPDGRFENFFVATPPQLQDGEEIFRHAHPGAGVEVGAEVAFSDVVFVDAPFNGRSVIEELAKYIDFVASVLNDLESLT